MNRILIIDDNEKLCVSLKRNFDQRGFACDYAITLPSAMNLINNSEINLILLDVVFGEEDGLDVLKLVLDKKPDIPVIMITGFATIESAVSAIKIGAFDYIQKPLNFEKLLKLVENAIRMSQLERENSEYKKIVNRLSPKIITKSPAMIKLYERALCIAQTDIPILIQGENGTGKELLADYIHENSLYSAKKMLKINCAAFPENLLDNELFGHEKGAFTGANSVYNGVFERANNSSLMLDEIGDMELTTQAKILRAIQNGEISRIGGSKTIKIKVRFIAATNKNLKEMIDNNEFRNDLFYRLNAATLQLPPLRERKEDIPLLVEHFIKEFILTNDSQITGVSTTVMDIFMRYDWPGNIRELRNAINYAAALSKTGEIRQNELPPVFEEVPSVNPAESPLDINEKNVIIKVLEQTRYNKKKAAELLNISRRTLYNKIEKYGLQQ
ncbi:MAG: sigma-54-dependent Fis family transcriptional regulator [Spirochaetes bacterium]|nr:sigma-54-dependent Fis family transcriptional regulator [Spirochaetota bacterium]MBN2771788.1 sigma-54-dependent Fis family transcriptional regulator [Spirochaetota bacterium]